MMTAAAIAIICSLDMCLPHTVTVQLRPPIGKGKGRRGAGLRDQRLGTNDFLPARRYQTPQPKCPDVDIVTKPPGFDPTNPRGTHDRRENLSEGAVI